MPRRTAERAPGPSNRHAGRAAPSSASQRLELTYFGDPGDCDVCGRQLRDETFFCDAQLPAHGGQWGVLCEVCTHVEGIRPGWGQAQFYERATPDCPKASAPEEPDKDVWRCVAGKPPTGLELN